MAFTLWATYTPPRAPASTPEMPIRKPSATNTRLMPREFAPMALSIPMSLVFSITIMMSELDMLKHATITISASIRNIIFFSSASAATRFLSRSIQLLTTKGYPSIAWTLSRKGTTAISSSAFNATPETAPFMRNIFAAVPRSTIATFES